MRFPKLLCATVGLLTLGVTAFAQDTSVNYFAGSGSAGAVTYTDTNSVGGTALGGGLYSHTDSNVYVGPITAQTVDPVTGKTVSFTVYCVDLENLAVNPTSALVNTIDPTSVTGTNHYDLSSPNYTSTVPGTYNDLIKASWLIDTYDPTSSLTGDAGAALQLAIWDVVDEAYNPTLAINATNTGPFGFTGGADAGAIESQAAAYITALKGITDFSGVQGVFYQVDRPNMGGNPQGIDGQDMLAGSSGFKSHALTTPEGASLLMFLPGLIPVAVGLRRRRNQSVGK